MPSETRIVRPTRNSLACGGLSPRGGTSKKCVGAEGACGAFAAGALSFFCDCKCTGAQGCTGAAPALHGGCTDCARLRSCASSVRELCAFCAAVVRALCACIRTILACRLV